MGRDVARVFGCGYDSDAVLVEEVWREVEEEESGFAGGIEKIKEEVAWQERVMYSEGPVLVDGLRTKRVWVGRIRRTTALNG